MLQHVPAELPDCASLDELREIARGLVEIYGSYRKLAEHVGLSGASWHQFISNYSNRRPGSDMLEALGYVEDPPVYRRVK